GCAPVERRAGRLVTLEIQPERRAARAGAREAHDDPRRLAEDHSQALIDGERAVDRILIAELIGFADRPFAELLARQRAELIGEALHYRGRAIGGELFVTVPLEVVAAVMLPMPGAQLRNRIATRREHVEPREHRPDAVLLAHVARARAEALLAADVDAPGLQQIGEELPAARGLEVRNRGRARDVVDGATRRHRACDAD